MNIHDAYEMEMERIDACDEWSEEEKQEERMAVEEQAREAEYARQAEHENVERRYGY